ncbi:MAG: DHH family phosphoesterase [Thermovirgaceae bacterium]
MKNRKTGQMTASLEQIHRVLLDAGWWVILAHERPDGDTIGCGSALAKRAEILGKGWSWFGPDELPGAYGFLWGAERYRKTESLPTALVPENSAIVVLDTSSADRTVPVDEERLRATVLNIDHHGDNGFFGDVNLVRSEAPAVAEPLWDLYEHAGWVPDPEEAKSLYTALVTDTGHFRFEGTSAKTLRIAAKLVENGVKPHEIYALLYENRSLCGLQLWGRGFLRARTFAAQKACATWLAHEDFAETKATREDTEHLVNELLQLKGIKIAFLLVEEDGFVRVSIRTKAPYSARDLASLWGGGGHIRAAGCKIESGLEEALETVIRKVEENDGKRIGPSG